MVQRTPEALLRHLGIHFPDLIVCNCAGCGQLLAGDNQPVKQRMPKHMPIVATRIDGRPYGICCSEQFQLQRLGHQRARAEYEQPVEGA